MCPSWDQSFLPSQDGCHLDPSQDQSILPSQDHSCLVKMVAILKTREGILPRINGGAVDHLKNRHPAPTRCARLALDS
jgi:hypothetical protein